MSRLLRRTLIAVAACIVIYGAALIYFGLDTLTAGLRNYRWSMLVVALGLSSLNYLLRFLKWELCLGWLGVRGYKGQKQREGDAPSLSLTRSLQIYLAGLSMSVSPGKLGEVLRSSLLHSSAGVPFARTAPIVVADRLTDLIALVILMLVGLAEFPEFLVYAAITLGLVSVGVVVLGTPSLFSALLDILARLPWIGRFSAKARGLVDSSATLLRLRPLAILTAISVMGWGLECLGYWAILHGFPGAEASLQLCTFLWATTTVIGALSFLPGGVGATEASLGTMVREFAVGISEPIMLASTLVIRLCTLWYGELVGAICLVLPMERSESEAAFQDPPTATAADKQSP